MRLLLEDPFDVYVCHSFALLLSTQHNTNINMRYLSKQNTDETEIYHISKTRQGTNTNKHWIGTTLAFAFQTQPQSHSQVASRKGQVRLFIYHNLPLSFPITVVCVRFLFLFESKSRHESHTGHSFPDLPSRSEYYISSGIFLF